MHILCFLSLNISLELFLISKMNEFWKSQDRVYTVNPWSRLRRERRKLGLNSLAWMTTDCFHRIRILVLRAAASTILTRKTKLVTVEKQRYSLLQTKRPLSCTAAQPKHQQGRPIRHVSTCPCLKVRVKENTSLTTHH